MLAPVKERLAKVVAAKRLTQQQADALVQRLEKRIEQRIQRTRSTS